MTFAWLRRWWGARYPFYWCGIVLGIGVLWWPWSTQRDLGDWAVRLRAEGVPTQAIVYDRVIRKGDSKTPDSRTMYLRYDFAGGSRTGEVGCWTVCDPPGTAVRIWVNSADPTDFVAEFGTLSGNRGRVQAGFGFAGAMVAFLCAATALERRHRLRGRVRGRRKRK